MWCLCLQCHSRLLIMFTKTYFAPYFLWESGELQCFEGEHYDNKKLRVFHSDPLDYHSIMDALKGCSGLFYSFEPSSDQPTYDVCLLLPIVLFLFSYIYYKFFFV